MCVCAYSTPFRFLLAAAVDDDNVSLRIFQFALLFRLYFFFFFSLFGGIHFVASVLGRLTTLSDTNNIYTIYLTIYLHINSQLLIFMHVLRAISCYFLCFYLSFSVIFIILMARSILYLRCALLLLLLPVSLERRANEEKKK